jgi:hypothetical protein
MSKENDLHLKVAAKEDESADNALSRALIRPSLNSAISIKKINRLGTNADPNVNALIDELSEQIKAVNADDMSRPEALLIAQAHTLDALFGRLLDAALVNMGEYIEAVETYMRLALKAQSQSAQTIRVLNELKNPSNLAFIQQNNVASGHQQVNNHAHADKTEIGPSELLESEEHERLDFGAPKETVRANSTMAAVGKVVRAKKRKRKKQIGS